MVYLYSRLKKNRNASLITARWQRIYFNLVTPALCKTQMPGTAKGGTSVWLREDTFESHALFHEQSRPSGSRLRGPLHDVRRRPAAVLMQLRRFAVNFEH